MNKKNQTGAIIGLLGIAASAFALWKYKTMPQEDKDKLHANVKKTGQRIKESVQEVEEIVTEKYTQLKDLASAKANEVA